jgi:hypothetical protein
MVDTVISDFVRNNFAFTALDVSNKVKETMPFARHREIRNIVRNAWENTIEPAGYSRSPITVNLADGSTAKAILYHPLSDSWNLDSKYYVAENNNTSPATLALLAKDNDVHVRQNVAENNNTSAETLALLARDNGKYIRQNVAENNNTSTETLALLARDNDVSVRKYVAENNNTSPATLALLAKDNDVHVRQSVAENNNTSKETLDLLAKNNGVGVFVKRNVAKNNNTSQETLVLLAKDNNAVVRADDAQQRAKTSVSSVTAAPVAVRTNNISIYDTGAVITDPNISVNDGLNFMTSTATGHLTSAKDLWSNLFNTQLPLFPRK